MNFPFVHRNPLKEKNPSVSAPDRLNRARLITALLDGVTAQSRTASKGQLAKLKADAVDFAVHIAMR